MAFPRPRTTLDWIGTVFLVLAVVAIIAIWVTIGPSRDERRAARQAASASSSSASAASAAAEAAASGSSSSTTAEPEPTSTSTSPSSTASVGANERPLVPGPTVAAAALDEAPTIDGRTAGDPWSAATTFTTDEQVDGEGKPVTSAKWKVGWDADNLYILAIVTDPAIVQTHTLRPYLIGTGDVVGFELGEHLEVVRTDRFAGGETKTFIGPLEAGGVTRTLLEASGDTFEPGAAFTQGNAIVRRTSDGYVAEAAIPWSAYGLDDAKPGATYAANFLLADAVSSGADRGKAATLQSNNEQRRGNNVRFRYTWGVLELAG